MPSSARPRAHGTATTEDVVEVGTALEVLRRVDLRAESNALAVDIGGSLAKLLYIQPYGAAVTSPRLVIDRVGGSPARGLSVHVPALNGTLHCFAFETRCVEALVAFMAEHWVKPGNASAISGNISAPATRGPGSARSLAANRRARGRARIGGASGSGSDSASANDAASGAGASVARNAHRYVRATGGGAYKYADMFEEEIGVTLVRQDEMTCVVAGLNFLLSAVDREVYTFKPPCRTGSGEQAAKSLADRSNKPPVSMENARAFVESSSDPFPYLLVNIGSGVSIVKVTGFGEFERVSGSSLGGGTFWGLARMLLNCKTFDEVISLTNGADNANVDMLVSDIYGGGYDSLGLGADVIAASFGKVTMRKEATTAASVAALWRKFMRALKGSISVWLTFWLAVPFIGAILRATGLDQREANSLANLSLASLFRPQDVALALLRMVSYNIGQIAYLNARVHGLERIYFAGHFIRDHPHTIADLSFAVDFWSGGATQALFLRHDGYLGAIGAFLGGSADPDNIAKAAKSISKPGGKLDSSSESGSKESASADSGATSPDGSESMAPSDMGGGKGSGAVDAVLHTLSNGTVGDGLDEEAPGTTHPSAKISVNSLKLASTAESTGPASGLKKKKRKKKKAQNAGGGQLAAGHRGSTPVDSGSRAALNETQDNVIYYDDVYDDTYRDAVEGEWQTVARRARRTPGTSQSESEDPET